MSAAVGGPETTPERESYTCHRGYRPRPGDVNRTREKRTSPTVVRRNSRRLGEDFAKNPDPSRIVAERFVLLRAVFVRESRRPRLVARALTFRYDRGGRHGAIDLDGG